MEFLALVREADSNKEREEESVHKKLSPKMQRVALLVSSIGELERRLVEVGSEYATPNVDRRIVRNMRDVERDFLEERVASFFVDCQGVLRSLGWEKDAASVFERGVRAAALQRLQDLAAAFRELQQLRARRDALRQHPRLWTFQGENDPWKQKKTTRQKVEVAPVVVEAATLVKKVPVFPHEESVSEQHQKRQQQQIQRERQLLTAEINHGEYDAARQVEARMHQVSQLVTTFAALTAEQHETVATLFDTVEDVADNVDKGRDQLHRSVSRKTSFPDVFVAIVLALTFAILLMHWIAP